MMNYTVGMLWALYIVVVLVIFLIMKMFTKEIQKQYPSCGYGCCATIAAIVGAVTVFFGAKKLMQEGEINSVEEQNWLNILYLVSYLLPVVMIIWLVWKREDISMTGEDYSYQMTE